MMLAADVLHHAGPLLMLGIVILAGVAGGALARGIGLPGVTGQIVAGVAIGRSGLGLFHDDALADLTPLTDVALGLIAVTVGAHLNVQRLRNAGRRLFLLLVTESVVMPAIVLAALWLVPNSSPQLDLLLAAVAIATAPATTVAIVKETRSKGVLVKTLIAAVALNNMACIVVFEVARTVARSWHSPLLSAAPAEGLLGGPLADLGIAVAIGVATALAMDRLTRWTVRSDRLATGAVVALVLCSGLATTLGVSPLLACLVLGLVQTNVTQTRSHLVDSVFADFQPAILAVFFTLAGMHLTMDHISVAGALSAIYFVARLGGKLLSADVAMRLAGATDRVRRNLGIALMPQAGVAVGLVIVIEGDPAYAHLAEIFAAIVLVAVTANEIVGPFLTRIALDRAGEIGQDRLRLMDFLQEENIVTSFHADSKDEAIEKLVDLLLRTHDLHRVDRAALLASVREREREMSTCLGAGLAVPHGILPAGHPMVGVMALSREGLAFETPDGRPVHCMVLLGTSPEERDRHLQVLAALARTIGGDPVFQDQLFIASSAAHACDVLHGEESEDFNYFLEASPAP
jgi:fructose PTS system EIIBC or EIIC component